MSGVQKVTVGPGEGDRRFDRWFRERFPQVSQSMLQKWLRKGQVRLDGARVKAADRVAEGQVVRVPPLPAAVASAEAARPPVDPKLLEDLRRAIVYQDEHVVAIDKPAGLAVQGGSGQRSHVDAALPYLLAGDREPLRLVHRIDKATSGLLVLGRTRRAATELTRAFRERDVEKTYVAIVRGVPVPAAGVIDLPIWKAPDGSGNARMRTDTQGARDTRDLLDARSEYQTIQTDDEQYSWLVLRPLTGRTHQLRAHLAAIGCPILGDDKYGDAESQTGVGTRSKNLHLHALSLVLPHPVSGAPVELYADIPGHFGNTARSHGWDPDACVAASEAAVWKSTPPSGSSGERMQDARSTARPVRHGGRRRS